MIPGKTYTPEDIAFIAWRRKWWAILPAIVITAGVFGWVRTLPNQYMSDTLILVVPQQVPETYVRSISASKAKRSWERPRASRRRRTARPKAFSDLLVAASRSMSGTFARRGRAIHGLEVTSTLRLP